MQMYPSEYKIDQPRKGIRNSLMLVVALLIVTALVMMVYYFTKVNRAATDQSHEVQFKVEKGLTTKEIASLLYDEKVIGSKYIFLVYAKLHGVGNKIQAGDYVLNSNMTVPEIVDVLTHGKVVTDAHSLTFIEGWSNRQVGKYLADRNIIGAASDLEKVLSDSNFDFKFQTLGDKFGYEGFLFPDTYKLSKDGTAFDLVSKMLNNFESRVTDEMVSDIGKNGYDLGQVLTVASIVEKEVGRNKENLTDEDLELMQRERELVASVFYNRLEIGMALESDATVNFITGKADRSVSIDDTKIQSPYNTYQVKGLPPTPIGNPGLDAIKAAIYPASSDYLFFLNSPDGVAYFGKTLAEHNENRVKYLR